ncbi:heat shock 70 kDa protein cognate 2-like [Durio zibethinus]|uniref:Heat shock 70 kDa protein cognate 2-like n=1 Tax=Durio zibethinus TaxID=66656 RepID=A0A6P5XKU9_DURZI|nr:heat shock 70 kDa protein cognate 2-like [Durio zibethinus]
MHIGLGRHKTKDVGRIVGLEVLRNINEPTFASLAYGFEENNKNIVLFDHGCEYLDMVIKVPVNIFKRIINEDTAKPDLNYTGLDGEIGCMVNGTRNRCLSREEKFEGKSNDTHNSRKIGWCCNSNRYLTWKLLDVTALLLGLETLSGVTTKIVMSNTAFPTSKLEVFSTIVEEIEVKIDIDVLVHREFKSSREITCKIASNLPKFFEVLKCLAKFPSRAICTIEELGENIVVSAKELYLDYCLNDLQKDFRRGNQIIPAAVTATFVYACHPSVEKFVHLVMLIEIELTDSVTIF